eukprot:8436644-Lingulodinium_polyedra.AAC.1
MHLRTGIDQCAHGVAVSVVANAILQGVVDFAIRLAGREALSRSQHIVPEEGTPLAPTQPTESAAVAQAPTVEVPP